MRIVICDDDTLIRKQMMDYLGLYFAKKKVHTVETEAFPDAYALLKDKGSKDIVFLDMEMPGMNGIAAGRALKEMDRNVIIIVISGYSAYIEEAVRFQAFRFLHKPVDRQRLFRCLDEALEYFFSRSVKLVVSEESENHVLDSSEVIMVETKERKTVIHTAKKEYCSSRSLSYWMNRLPRDSFVLTHRSYLVNVNYVERFNRSTVYLSERKLQAYLTRRKIVAFKNAVSLYGAGPD